MAEESSYPTYEEWKHPIVSFFACHVHCSYPTYEEWKHFVYSLSVCFPFTFLSYL